MTGDAQGRSLELFFIDGKPDGMLTAKFFNWTGHVLMTPRTQISEALKREESHYTGIYLLFGERDGEPLAYIGEGVDVSKRIEIQAIHRDWWTQAILITSAANNLNKAHGQYLESRLIEEARALGRVALENATTPPRPPLSEADKADMEAFLANILMVLPALRIDCFLQNIRPRAMTADTVIEAGNRQAEPAQVFELRTKLTYATAVLEEGEFIVLEGAKTPASWVGKKTENTTYGQLFADLVKTGILVKDGAHRVFKENYAFRSPSAAASVVTGRPTNGAFEWKVKDTGKPYRDWEAEKLDDE